MNIVLLVADTWRLKDVYSKEGVIDFLEDYDKDVITDYYSTSPWTVPAHASMFTGQLPSENSTTTEKPYFDSENILTSELDKLGFRTVGISENPLFSESTGLSEGFDKFIPLHEDSLPGDHWKEFVSDYESNLVNYVRLFTKSLFNRDVDSIKSAFRNVRRKLGYEEDYNPTYTEYTTKLALKELEEGNTFLTLNLMPTHLSYTFTNEEKEKILECLDEKEILSLSKKGSSKIKELNLGKEDAEKRRRIYEASVRYLERSISKLIEESPEDTIFVIIGDHGELIGEYEKNGYRIVGHHFGTFKELIKVPLIITPSQENLDIGLSDHRSLIDIITSIAKNEQKTAKQNIVRSEYFGKKGFMKNLSKGSDDGFESAKGGLVERKSFSVIDEEIKYDITTEGNFLWGTRTMREENQVSIDKLPEEFSQIEEIYYKWRLNTEEE